MGGHVDATLGVRTGRLWVVLTISPHKYVLSGACVVALLKHSRANPNEHLKQVEQPKDDEHRSKGFPCVVKSGPWWKLEDG